MKTGRLSRPIRRVLVLLIIITIAGGIAYVQIQRTGTNQNPLRLYGNVDIREVQLAFRQPGRIASMMFDEGDPVSPGMPMAKLDDQPYRDALASAEASVQVAQAELSKLRSGLRPQEIVLAQEALKQAQAIAVNAERNYQRQTKLRPSGASSQSTVDAARAERDQSVAGVETAKARLSLATEGFRQEDIAAAQALLAAAQATRDQAATALADTVLLTPSTGTVITRIREPGSMVASQNPVYSLSLDKPVYVRAYIGEPDLGRIAPGMAVSVSNDSSNKIYRGQIGFISPRAEFTPKTVETTDLRTDLVYRLRIVIDEADSDKGLRQGMPVTIDVNDTANNPPDQPAGNP